MGFGYKLPVFAYPHQVERLLLVIVFAHKHQRAVGQLGYFPRLGGNRLCGYIFVIPEQVKLLVYLGDKTGFAVVVKKYTAENVVAVFGLDYVIKIGDLTHPKCWNLLL